MGKVGKFVGKVGKFVGKVGNSWARSGNSWARSEIGGQGRKFVGKVWGPTLPTNFLPTFAHEFPTLPTNFRPCPRISRPCPRIADLAHEFPGLAHEFPTLPTNFRPCPPLPTNSRISRPCPRISDRAHEFPTLPTNFRPCPRISRLQIRGLHAQRQLVWPENRRSFGSACRPSFGSDFGRKRTAHQEQLMRMMRVSFAPKFRSKEGFRM